jgi:hypothetical protein
MDNAMPDQPRLSMENADARLPSNNQQLLQHTGLRRFRAVAALAAASVSCALLAGCAAQPQPDRSHPPMDITNNPQTYCIGRVLVDLPQSLSLSRPEVAKTISSSLDLDGMQITTRTNVSQAEFQRLVEARWKEVQGYTRNSNNKPYAQPSSRQNIRTNGVLLAFRHEMIRSNARWVNGQREFDNVMLHDAEGYFWDNGTMFTVKDDSNRRVNEKITGVISQMRFMRQGDVPDEPGICIDGGFIAHHYRSTPERYLWSVTLPRGLRLHIQSGTDVREKPMLERFRGLPRANLEDDDMVYGTQQYRAAHRTDGHLPADEMINGVTKGDEEPGSRPKYETSVSGRWEYMGQKPPNAAPFVRAEMSLEPIKTTYRPAELGGYPPQMQGSIHPTQEEFMAVWDLVMGSIRFYPGALNRAPQPPKPLSLGPDAQQRAADHKTLDDFLNGKT